MGYSPTRLTLILAIPVVALSVVMLVDSSLFAPWLAVVGALVLGVVVDTLMLPKKGSVRVERHLPSEVGIGSTFVMRVRVVNDSRRNQGGKLYDIVPEELDGPRGALKYHVEFFGCRRLDPKRGPQTPSQSAARANGKERARLHQAHLFRRYRQ